MPVTSDDPLYTLKLDPEPIVTGKDVQDVVVANVVDGAEGKVTQDTVNIAVTKEVSDALDALASGTNPLTSKTIILNGIAIIAGIVGATYSMVVSGNSAQAIPFLVATGLGAINTVLRFITSTPIMTKEMAAIINAYTMISNHFTKVAVVEAVVGPTVIVPPVNPPMPPAVVVPPVVTPVVDPIVTPIV